MESLKPQRPAMTKNTAGLSGFGLQRKSVIIKAALSAAPKRKIGTRPTFLTIEPQMMDPTASAAP